MWITNSYESEAGVVFATSDKSQKHRVCVGVRWTREFLQVLFREYHVLYFPWTQKVSVWERRKINWESEEHQQPI